MAQASKNPARRRIWLLIAAGLALIVIMIVIRIVTTDAVAQWRSVRLSDDDLAKVAKEENASYPFVYEWAKRLETNGHFAEAERVYVRAAQIGPTRVEAWLGFGRTAFAARDWGKADAVLAKTVEQWPDNADARFTYASVLASTFRIRKALEQMKAGLKRDPARGEAYRTLGDLENREGNFPAALDAYVHAKTLMPNAKGLKGLYGTALVSAGKYVEAKKELEDALKDDPSDVNVRFQLARALSNTGDEQDRARALQELNRVVNFSENKSRAYAEAARIWLRNGDRGNAIQALEHAYDANPYNPEILTMLAQAYEEEGRKAETIKVRKALDQLQAFAEERKAVLARLETDKELIVNLIQLGRVDRKAHNLIEAQIAFEAASLMEPGNAEATQELKAMAKLLPNK